MWAENRRIGKGIRHRLRFPSGQHVDATDVCSRYVPSRVRCPFLENERKEPRLSRNRALLKISTAKADAAHLNRSAAVEPIPSFAGTRSDGRVAPGTAIRTSMIDPRNRPQLSFSRLLRLLVATTSKALEPADLG